MIIALKGMSNWLRAYEDRRTDPYTYRKELLSSRFDLSGLSWDEIRAIPIPELGEDMTFGRSFEALRKTWYSYKRNKKDGFPAPDLCYRILKIQRALGLPLSQFEELEQYGDSGNDWANKQLSAEEQELRQEEINENKDEWD